MLTQNGNIYKMEVSLIEPTCLGFYFTLLLTIWSLRLVVRTSGFHPGNRGSIPLGTTKRPVVRLVFYILGCLLIKVILQYK